METVKGYPPMIMLYYRRDFSDESKVPNQFDFELKEIIVGGPALIRGSFKRGRILP